MGWLLGCFGVCVGTILLLAGLGKFMEAVTRERTPEEEKASEDKWAEAWDKAHPDEKPDGS